MAGFVQIIEYQTSRRDEMDKLMDRWIAETQGKRSASRAVTTSDRDRANTYIEIVEFPSYEQAMRNSDLPATSAFAQEFSKLCDSGPEFRNLDALRTDQL
jgi:hypothetical protein